MIEDMIRKIQHIEFNEASLNELVVNSILESYSESGGNNLAIACIDHEGGRINFDPLNTLKSFDVSSVLSVMRTSEVDSFVVNKEDLSIYGVSLDSGVSWLVCSGSNKEFISAILEPLWYSVFEL